jgi:hypothetical protein
VVKAEGSSDTLTAVALENAIRLLERPPLTARPVYLMHPDAARHVTDVHPDPVLDCAECVYAWSRAALIRQ